MNCPYCGENVTVNQAFCPKCGNRLIDHVITTDYQISFNDIKEAYNNGEISEDEINKAVFKVLALKYSLGVLHD